MRLPAGYVFDIETGYSGYKAFGFALYYRTLRKKMQEKEEKREK